MSFNQDSKGDLTKYNKMLNQVIKRQFASATNHHARVAIVGAGTAGTNVCAQLINSGKIQAKDIAIIDPSLEHHYQPGYTCVAGGVWGEKQQAKWLIRPRKDNLAAGVNWV